MGGVSNNSLSPGGIWRDRVKVRGSQKGYGKDALSYSL